MAGFTNKGDGDNKRVIAAMASAVKYGLQWKTNNNNEGYDDCNGKEPNQLG